jgi:hypothetical protein
MTEVLALTRTNIEGALVVIVSLILFCGSVYLLLSAVFGLRMAYLIAATALFAFMIILSAIWAFGAPGTPKYLGPQGKLPAWVTLAAGTSVRSSSLPVVAEYPRGPWRPPGTGAVSPAEVEPATLAFRDFLAEEANAELRRAGQEGSVAPADFQITDLRFAEVDGRLLAAARGFAAVGGPEVTVVGFKHEGDVGTPSYAFLIASVIGFAAHLPFLDRAEKKRKEILTGGRQAPWRGPA